MKLGSCISLIIYLSPMLAEQYPELCASLHAGWGAVFGKTMCMEQMRWPPEIGPTAYTDEELKWCSATLDYLVHHSGAAGGARRKVL
jgi:hypothetical protein